MAQPNLENFTDRGLLLAAADTTLLPGTHALQILDGKSTTTADEIERNLDNPILTNSPVLLANHRASIEGRIEIAPPVQPGHATDGIAPITPALLPCGMALALNALLRTSVLTPVSTGFVKSDAKWFHTGTLIAPTDMAGDISNLRMAIGEAFTAQLKIEGQYDAETEAALPTDFDFSDFVTPTLSTFDNSTLVLNSLGAAAITDLHLWGKSLQVSFGQEVKTHEFTEHKETAINARKGTFEAVFALTDLDDCNPRELMRTHERITLAWTLTEADGRYSRLQCRGQITAVSDENVDGKRGFKISGRCIATAVGNDFGVAFGDFTFRLNGTLNNGTDDVVYVANGLTPSGNYTAPLTWDISAGALPAGLAINSATGVITGTPTTAGVVNFTIRATDSTGGTPLVATKAVTITIAG